MTDLSGVPSAELHRELQRRKDTELARQLAAMNEKYGPCDTCGEPVTGYDWKAKQILTAPGWNAWPLDPPPHLQKTIGQEWEATLTCAHGHESHRSGVRFFEEPKMTQEPT